MKNFFFSLLLLNAVLANAQNIGFIDSVVISDPIYRIFRSKCPGALEREHDKHCFRYLALISKEVPNHKKDFYEDEQLIYYRLKENDIIIAFLFKEKFLSLLAQEKDKIIWKIMENKVSYYKEKGLINKRKYKLFQCDFFNSYLYLFKVKTKFLNEMLLKHGHINIYTNKEFVILGFLGGTLKEEN